MHWMISSTDVCVKAACRQIFEDVISPHPSRVARHLLPLAGEVKAFHLSRLWERTMSAAKQVRAVNA